MSQRRKFLKRAGYTTLSTLLAMGFLHRDKGDHDRENAAFANYEISTTPLRQLAAAKGMRYGAAIAGDALQKEADYANLLARECSIATPNGELKWSATEPQPGVFTFTAADAIAKFCQNNNMAMHGHTLVWHTARPDWVPYPPTPSSFSIFERHVRGVMGHYRNSTVLKSWDVANEVIANSPEETDNPYGIQRGFKPEVLRDLFLLAASVDPNKKLCLNEFGIENGGWKAQQFLKTIEYLKNNGVKIDWAGFQSHLWFSTAYPFDATGFSNVLQRLKDMGVKPVITELDIIIDTPFPATLAQLDQMVADGYKRFLDLCFAGGVDTIITWGITDRHTWIRQPEWMPQIYKNNPQYQNYLRPLPFDQNLQRKQAFYAISQAFKEARDVRL
ncbi:endo-1,4-beta-xylanase [Anabaena azotica]|uniref:Beta-xylanase n=1 Tax=Anabaena azotica FACHB-119 TaxID=947527 RepID=A0ABR8DAY9_9NOST|nr:endo-1,4-beta-xylanase [Anabaena azotica]MBD2504264.1 endo-1,4-beta-xylanase [Anabaena azotica FACHB-119]